MHIINKQILKIIREFVNDTKLTMSEVAREAGISKAWISRLTNDANPNMSIETAAKLLDVAGYELIIKKITTAGSEDEIVEANIEENLKENVNKPFSRLRINHVENIVGGD